MARELAAVAVFIFAIACGQSLLTAGPTQVHASSVEIALVANAEAGTVVLVDVATRSDLRTIDVNPEHERARVLARRTTHRTRTSHPTAGRSTCPAAIWVTLRHSTS